MGLIEYYFIFAITTAAAGHYELVSPTLNELKLLNPGHNLIEYRVITSITFFLMNVILAPVIFLPCIIPSIGKRFREGLLRGFKE